MTRPPVPNVIDVIILGGGPAGMSALLWCHSLGLQAALLEIALSLGGQMNVMFHPIIDYPGLPGHTGAQMRDRFLAHLEELNLDFRVGCTIENLKLQDRSLRCNDELLEGRALIIAAGARKRSLGVPGEERFSLAGVSYSATRDHSLYAGKPVAVVGGGDSAVENSLILSRICPRVDLIHRSADFRARASWLAEARATANIRIHTGFEVKAIEGSTRVETLILEEIRTNQRRSLTVEGVFIRLGIAPNSEMFRQQLDLDEAGYIKVDAAQATSVEHVYAIGDICRPLSFSIATAAGHAALATKAIVADLKLYR
jgi:thioredoxin reductase (NADPH)